MLAVVLRPSKMRYDASRSLTKTKRMKAGLTAFFSVAIAVVLFFSIQFGAVFWVSQKGVYALEQTIIVPAAQPTGANQDAPAQSSYNQADVQNALKLWAKKYAGKASVSIINTKTGETIASSDENKEYFTASIYKLYVAYAGAQDIDAGLKNPAEKFLGTYTRQDCIVRMIQYSDSPCAEKMLNEMGKATLNTRLKELGLTGTVMPRFTTTSHDSALVTRLIALGDGLSATQTKILRDAMAAQVYRTGLPQGFKNSKVEDKVGFYQVGYHDSANVTPQNGTTFTISVMTQNMGSREIAELARTLEPLFSKL